MDVGSIKLIRHLTWIANIIPVKKNNRCICCCIEFCNFKKACPKDEFSLSNIDMLVDVTAGHSIFSFLDGFYGFNQIKMNLLDAEKTVFPTPTGNFLYTVMLFGLKNVGATDQHIMTVIFHKMLISALRIMLMISLQSPEKSVYTF